MLGEERNLVFFALGFYLFSLGRNFRRGPRGRSQQSIHQISRCVV